MPPVTPGRRRADVGAGAQRVQRPHRLGQHLRDAGGLERELHAAAAGGVADRLDRVDVGRGAPGGWRRTRRPARSREARRLTATIVVAPASRAAMTAHSPTEPGAEDRHRRARGHPQDVEHGARAGLHAAGQRPGDAQVDVVGDLDRAAGVGDRQACRRTTARRSGRRPAGPARRWWRPTRRAARSGTSARRWSRSRPSGRCGSGCTTPQDGKLRTTLSPGGEAADLAAGLPHDPGALVAEDGRQRLRPGVAHQQVGVAHAGGDDLDEDLVRPRPRRAPPARAGTGRPAPATTAQVAAVAGVVTGSP